MPWYKVWKQTRVGAWTELIIFSDANALLADTTYPPRRVSPQQLAPSPSVLNATLGDAGRLVDITGFGLLLTVLGKLYSATATAAGSATIVG